MDIPHFSEFDRFIFDGQAFERDENGGLTVMNDSVQVREYALPDGRTFQLNEDDAKRLGAKLVNRAMKITSGEVSEKTQKTGKKDEKANASNG